MAFRDIGSVFINVLANTKTFERQAQAAAKRAGDNSGKTFAERFERNASRQRFNRMYSAWEKRQRPLASRMGDKMSRVFSLAWGNGMTRHARMWYRAIVMLMEPLVAVVAGAAGSLVALVGNLGSAAMSAGALVPLLGGVAGALGTLVIGSQGVGKAMGAVNEEFRTALEEGRAFNLEAENIQKALGLLAPSAADTVVAFANLRGELRGIAQGVQERLFSGMADSLTNLAEVLLPQVEVGFNAFARSLNAVGKNFMSMLEGVNFEALLLGLDPIVDSLGEAFVSLSSTVLGFMEAATPAGQRLAEAVAKVAENLNGWVTENPERINEALQTGMDRMSAWGGMLDGFAAGFKNIFSIGADSADGMIAKLDGVGEKFRSWTESVSGRNQIADFMDRAGEAMEALGPAISGLATGLNNIFTDTAVDNLRSLSEGLGKLLPVVGDLFAAFGQAGVMKLFGDTLGLIADIITPMMPTIQRLAQLVGDVLGRAFEMLAPVILQVMEAIMPLVDTLVSALAPVLDAVLAAIEPILPIIADTIAMLAGLVQPLLEPLGRLLAALAPILVQLFVAFNPVLRILAFLGPLLEPIMPLLEWLANALATVIDWLAGVVQAITPFVNEIIKWVAQGAILKGFFNLVGRGLAAVGQALGKVFEWFSRTGAKITEFASRAGQVIGNFVQSVVQFFVNLGQRIFNTVNNLVQKVVSFFTNMRSATGAQVEGLINRVVGFFTSLPGKVISAISSIVSRVGQVFSNIVNVVRNVPSQMASFFSSLPGRIMGFVSSIPGRISSLFSSLPGKMGSIVSGMASAFFSLPGRIMSAIGNVGSRILNSIVGSIPGPLRRFLPFASGGIVFGPTHALIGEAGPEVVIPLNKPLNQIDASVRGLAAQMRGEGKPQYKTGGEGAQKVVNVTIHVTPTQADPEAVAASVMNQAVVLARG